MRFLLLTVIGVGLLYFVINSLFFFGTTVYATPLHGLSGINFALLIAYATLFPERQLSMMMIFPMKARTFCWILIGIESYMAVFSSLTTSWAHLMAMGISYLIIRYQSLPLMRKVLNRSWSQKKTGKKHLYVVKDDDKNPPKYWQ
jgi:membrane associated rhomboid family serine protease